MTPYDEVAYPSHPYVQCHPDRLHLIARLYGMQPAPVSRCRVLEVGCGDGLNLVAAAIGLPDSEFIGIDISAEAIGRGAEMVADLALANTRLHLLDLCDLGKQWGRFDYIVAHGFYSWVPVAIRDLLLGKIRELLNPQGVGYVSYNAYPGAHLRQMAREMALLAGSVKGARDILVSAPGLVAGDGVYRAVLGGECAAMLEREPAVLFHDDLAPINQPVYFRDFVAHAERHRLQYLAEAELGSTGTFGLSPRAAKLMEERMPEDRIAQESLADFLRGRRFRQTLLCRAEIEVRREPKFPSLRDCYAGGEISMSPLEGGAYEYRSKLGGRIQTKSADDRVLLDALMDQWPGYLPTRGLTAEEQARIPHLFAARMIDVRSVAPPTGKRLSTRPEASMLARLQAVTSASVTNLHHLEVRLSSTEEDGFGLRMLLTLLDGSRTERQLSRELKKAYPDATTEAIKQTMQSQIEMFHRYALLIEHDETAS